MHLVIGSLWCEILSFRKVCFSLKKCFAGIKPLSIYGLIHIFSDKKESLIDGRTLSQEDQAKIVSMLREHLLDIDDGEHHPEWTKEKRGNGVGHMSLTGEISGDATSPTATLVWILALRRYDGKLLCSIFKCLPLFRLVLRRV
jgi:hypothetical protein